jgi:hypothetical protein
MAKPDPIDRVAIRGGRSSGYASSGAALAGCDWVTACGDGGSGGGSGVVYEPPDLEGDVSESESGVAE